MQKITFKNLPSTNTPLNATNMNLLQDNVEDAIDEASLETYSTSEKQSGTWINGKAIYQKTIYLSSLPNETSQTYNFSTYGITPTMLIDARGVAYNSSNGATFIINGARENFDGVIGLRSVITSSTKTFTIQTGQDRSSAKAYITFWYLKN